MFLLVLVVAVKNFSYIFLITFLSFFLPAFVYYRLFFNIYLLGGLVIFFLYLIFASKRTFNLVNNLLKIRFFLINRYFFSRVITGFLIFFMISFFVHYFDFKTQSFNSEINNWLFLNILNFSEPFLRLKINNFSFDLKLEEFLKNLSETQAKTLLKEKTNLFDLEDDFKKQVLIQKIFEDLKKEWQQNWPFLVFEKSLRDNFLILVNTYFNKLGENKVWLGVGVVVFIFRILRGLFSLFYWLVTFLFFIIFKFLATVNFLYVSLENYSKEVVNFS